MDKTKRLSRRERQIMDIIYALEQASASDVLEAMEDAPSRDSVRTLLRILEEKGHLKHKKEGRKFIYLPTRPRKREGQSALARVLDTFFNGSLEQALAAHLSDNKNKPTDEELKRLSGLIKKAREQGE